MQEILALRHIPEMQEFWGISDRFWFDDPVIDDAGHFGIFWL